ncbi:MAG: 30S ribosomal protein THX [Flavobacteriales bacterium]|jgi:ribosomal small subunit protein bTHX|nr:30S ribosomal protein THX [Flavobacteriales bacterium]MBT6809119.1 30S ribosomal protein THX [Flavobacteriales bacterium]
MGRGDIKTKKGKRFAGSYGKKRLKKAETEKFIAKAVKKEETKETVVKKTTAKKAAPKKKAAAKKTTKK